VVLGERELHPDELLEVLHRHRRRTLQEAPLAFTFWLTLLRTVHFMSVTRCVTRHTFVHQVRPIRRHFNPLRRGRVQVRLVVLQRQRDGVLGPEELTLLTHVRRHLQPPKQLSKLAQTRTPCIYFFETLTNKRDQDLT
jgi:hypothetical protein